MFQHKIDLVTGFVPPVENPDSFTLMGYPLQQFGNDKGLDHFAVERIESGIKYFMYLQPGQGIRQLLIRL